MYFITISRQTGSLGDEIAGLLSQRLGMELITHDFVMFNWLPEVANKYELHMLEESPKFYLNRTNMEISFAEFIENRLKEITEKHPVIVLGLGSQVIFGNNPYAINVRIIASNEVRVNRLMQNYGLERQEAEKLLELSDRKHKRYISTIYGKDWSDPMLYHLTLNTDNLGIEGSVGILSYLAELCKDLRAFSVTSGAGNSSHKQMTSKPPAFAHSSEEEFSKILDMYNIQWEYEPRTFPIEWDAEGNVTAAFTPDFYLPRFDTYIELTTMDQKYVAEKKRKVRRLKEIYPGININIIFKNDYHSLLRRFRIEKGDKAK